MGSAARSLLSGACAVYFELAKKECQDPSKLGAWLPQLGQYGPDLLMQCRNASEMSRELVQTWLRTYMFRNAPGSAAKARRIAKWLSTHRYFKSHGRAIPGDELKRRGLKIQNLEEDQKTQDLVLSIFHATAHTFGMTPAVKIIENHPGKVFIKRQQAVLVQLPNPQGKPADVPRN